MRPPTRTTRSTRQMSDGGDTPEPVRRPLHTKPSQRKLDAANADKKPRHRMTEKQLERLETLYEQDTHPTREQKQALGEEVGMDTRTVTVWFQNRRQLAKKQTLILGSAPQPMCRQPLRTVSQANSRQPSVSSASQPSAPHTPLFYSASRQQTKRLELWEHLPSSPVTTATVSAATSAMPSPLAKKFPGVFISQRQASAEGKENRKRKPILEWACARVSKRQRLQPVVEDDGDDETEDEEDQDVTLVDVGNIDDLKLVKGKYPDVLPKESAGSKRKIIAIPSRFSKDFTPDVVLGASLLLTFQQSYKAPVAARNEA